MLSYVLTRVGREACPNAAPITLSVYVHEFLKQTLPTQYLAFITTINQRG